MRNMSQSSKLKVSKKNSDKIHILSARLNLRRNIICRIAIGKSLGEVTSVKTYQLPEGPADLEFNRYTLTGEKDLIYKALVTQHEGRALSDGEYFGSFLRKHVERGVEMLSEEYNHINSPIEFLMGLQQKAKRRS